MKKTMVLLMLLAVISKVIGFLREVVLAYTYGAGSISDAYLIALTVPGLLLSFIGAAISVGYIPILTRTEENEGLAGGMEFTSRLLQLVFLFVVVLFFLGQVGTKYLVLFLASGFSNATLEIAIRMTKMTLWGMFFTLTNGVLVSYLQVKSAFIGPSLMGIPLNMITIASYFFSMRYGLDWLAWGSVAATAVQSLFLYFLICQQGFRYIPEKVLVDSKIREMGVLVVPLLLGVGADQLNLLIDRTLASRILEGGISALNYAGRLNGFADGIIAASVLSVIYPVLSKKAASGNLLEFKSSLVEGISFLAFFSFPASVGIMLLSEPLVQVLFQRGAFSPENAALTSGVLFYTSAGLFFIGLRGLLSRAFFSMADTRTPMRNGLITVLANIVLNLLLSKYMGIRGLALATSLSAFLGVSLLWLSLRRKVGGFGMMNLKSDYLKIFMSVSFMAASVWTSFGLLSQRSGETVSLIGAIAVGVLTYGGSAFVLRIKLLVQALDRAKEMYRSY